MRAHTYTHARQPPPRVQLQPAVPEPLQPPAGPGAEWCVEYLGRPGVQRPEGPGVQCPGVSGGATVTFFTTADRR